MPPQTVSCSGLQLLEAATLSSGAPGHWQHRALSQQEHRLEQPWELGGAGGGKQSLKHFRK